MMRDIFLPPANFGAIPDKKQQGKDPSAQDKETSPEMSFKGFLRFSTMRALSCGAKFHTPPPPPLKNTFYGWGGACNRGGGGGRAKQVPFVKLAF